MLLANDGSENRTSLRVTYVFLTTGS